MRIGIFDSGLGGLIVARAIRKALPQYDYVYLGDTKRVPYGNRSHDTVYEFTRECVEHLFEKENCAMVILACNTASARALRRLQQELTLTQPPPYSKGEAKEGVRKILGVLIPAAEEAAKFNRVGVLGTTGTVASNSFPEEIKKARKKLHPAKGGARIFQNPAPMLVPLAEAGETQNAVPFIQKYIKPLIGCDALVLGCTHYPIFKNQIKKIFKGVLISQDEIIPKKLKNYLARHPEIEKKLSRNRSTKILVTDETQTIDALTKKWFGNVKPRLITA